MTKFYLKYSLRAPWANCDFWANTAFREGSPGSTFIAPREGTTTPKVDQATCTTWVRRTRNLVYLGHAVNVGSASAEAK